MNKMRSLYMMSMGMAIAGLGNYGTSFKELEEDRLQRAERDRKLKQGLTEYLFAEGSIYALNKKTAIKKALKKNWSVLTIKEI